MNNSRLFILPRRKLHANLSICCSNSFDFALSTPSYFQVEKEDNGWRGVAFAVIDGSTFWSSRWGKVKVYGIQSPEEGDPEYEEAKEFLSDMLNSRSIKIIPIGENKKEGIVTKVLIDGEDLAEKIREKKG